MSWRELNALRTILANQYGMFDDVEAMYTSEDCVTVTYDPHKDILIFTCQTQYPICLVPINATESEIHHA